MKFSKRLVRGLLPVAVGGVLIAVFACTNGERDGGSAALRSGALSECEYADEVSTKLTTFATSTMSVMVSGNGADAPGALDRMNTQLEAMTRELRALKSTREVNELNQTLVSGLEELRNQLPEAKQAADAGDLAKMEATITRAMEDFSAKIEQSDKEHAGLSSRLTQCGS